jgi:hypothetical protein
VSAACAIFIASDANSSLENRTAEATVCRWRK